MALGTEFGRFLVPVRGQDGRQLGTTMGLLGAKKGSEKVAAMKLRFGSVLGSILGRFWEGLGTLWARF